MLTGHDGQRDRVYLVRMPRFDPVPLIGWEAMRDEFVHEIRWWSVDEIGATDGAACAVHAAAAGAASPATCWSTARRRRADRHRCLTPWSLDT